MTENSQNIIVIIILSIIYLVIIFAIGNLALKSSKTNKIRRSITSEYRIKYRKSLDCTLSVQIDSIIPTYEHDRCWLKIGKIDFVNYNKDMFPSSDSLLNYLDLVFYKTCDERYYQPFFSYRIFAEKRVNKIHLNFKKNIATFFRGNKIITQKGITMQYNWKRYTPIRFLPKCN